MKDDFIIFQKMYDFTVYFFPIITKMPKSHRFILGQQLENHCLLIMDLLTVVNKIDINKRKKYFKNFSNNFDFLVIRIRLAKDLKFITPKQYLNIVEKTNEIIKLIYN
jgi:hypothetical protein